MYETILIAGSLSHQMSLIKGFTKVSNVLSLCRGSKMLA